MNLEVKQAFGIRENKEVFLVSNLGAYQWMTTIAKKVGGPVNLLFLTGVAGAGVYKVGEVTVKKVIKTVKWNRTNKHKDLDSRVYTVSLPGKSNAGVAFTEGNQFRVLEIDGDAVLIEKIQDKKNPYFVSAELLRSISDYD